MAGWHHQLDWREFEWTPGVGDGQGGLTYWDSWGHKELDMTEQVNWTELTDKNVVTHRLIKIKIYIKMKYIHFLKWK